MCGAAQVMYRERAAGMYSELPFASAQCLIEVPYNLAQALLFSAISYFMLGFDHDAGESLGRPGARLSLCCVLIVKQNVPKQLVQSPGWRAALCSTLSVPVGMTIAVWLLQANSSTTC